MPTPRPQFKQFPYLFDSAFERSEQSNLAILKSVRDEDWAALPHGAKRSILNVVGHVGMFKFMYPGSAFRDRESDYGDDPVSPPRSRLASNDAVVDAFSELTDDAELNVPSKAHRGKPIPPRRLMVILLE